jgi:hypothetical protein
MDNNGYVTDGGLFCMERTLQGSYKRAYTGPFGIILAYT